MIKVKRAYEPASSDDGRRILVDRLWPRGISKDKAAIDEWLKDIAPSKELREWFSHDPAKWSEFKMRYRNELKDKTDLLKDLVDGSRGKTITLLFSAKDPEHNNALALKQFIEEQAHK